MPEIKRVACLYRVSTKAQLDENDIPMQKKACAGFIVNQPFWALSKEYVERGVSGYHKSAAQRDVLQQIKKDAEDRRFDILLVFMFDRLGRRVDETPFVVEWLAGCGIEVWSVVEGRQKLDGRADKLLNYIRFWQSDGESEKTSRRVAEKHRQMVKEGKFRGGSPPYGYLLCNSGEYNRKGYERKKLMIDAAEHEVVKTIFKLATEENAGGFKIAAYLNERSVPTKKGCAWTAQTVARLIKNPIYKGCYVSGRTRRDRGFMRPVSPEQWTYAEKPIDALAIVDEAIWERANALQKGRKHEKDAQIVKKSSLWLCGIAVCGHCGAKLASGGQAYHCPSKQRQKPCGGQYKYSAKKIDRLILEALTAYVSLPSRAGVQKQVNAKRAKIIKQGGRELLAMNRAIQQAERDFRTIQNEAADSLTGESCYTSKALSGMMKQKEKEIDSLKAEQAKMAAAFDAQSAALGDTEEERLTPGILKIEKEQLRRLVKSISVFCDKINIYFRGDNEPGTQAAPEKIRRQKAGFAKRNS